MMTSSPWSSIDWKRLYIECLPPQETITSSLVYESELSRLNLEIIASLSSFIPPTGVYFVCPPRIAFIAASFMFSGVSKSGSPAPKLIMSLPPAFKARALAVIASVTDSSSPESLPESVIILQTPFYSPLREVFFI